MFAIETDKEAFYPYLTAVKDYAEEYLEYWCRNIKGDADIELNIRIDKLEVYGTNAFVIGGGYDSVLVYFRPMSLIKFKNGEENILKCNVFFLIKYHVTDKLKLKRREEVFTC